MMFDPLSTLGVAAAVVQFVDFSIKLVSKQRDIERSFGGVLVEHKEIRAAAATLERECNILSHHGHYAVTKQQSSAGQGLLATVVERAMAVAGELRLTLDELYVTSVHKKFKSFRQALKSIRAKDQVDEMHMKLKDLRTELMLGLLISMREEQDFDTRARQAETKQSEVNILDALKRIEMENKRQLKDLQERTTPGFFSNRGLPARLLAARTWLCQNASLIRSLSTDVSRSVHSAQELQMRIKLLNSLSFPEMNLRYNEITVAQKRTFDWIYASSPNPTSRTQMPATNFTDWLTGKGTRDSRLYWVSGKPGSGKSTLMRFLSDDERTTTLSQQWSSGRQVLIASCFFWNPGTMRQKSQQGLLQSLLHQLLTRCPTLPGFLFAQRWHLLDLGAECDCDWSITELRKAVFACVNYLVATSNVLLFIDGLDEFHGDSVERQEICDLLIGLTNNHNVKVCTSSRPWNIYREAFEESFPMLRLEDLTRTDIRNYVEDEFRSHKLVQAWAATEPDHSAAFFTALVERAQGVFLWVRLVIRSLLAGLQNRDDITDLSRRLKEIPPDLEDYFKRMISTLDPFYLEQASQAFEVTLRGNQLLMTFCFMHETALEAGLNSSEPRLRRDRVLKLQTVEDRRLNARCIGLLESRDRIHESGIRYVTFLHRTARDFIVSDYAQNLLKSWRKNPFDSDTALLLSYICLLRSCDIRSPWLSPKLCDETILAVVEVAREMNLNNELYEIMEKFGQCLAQMHERHWSNGRTHYMFKDGSFDFLAFCVEKGLHSFALEKLRRSSENSLHIPRQVPLLHYALHGNLYRSNSSLAMVEQLLALGADVNERTPPTTVWGVYLSHLFGHYDDIDGIQQVYEVVKRLVKEGPLERVYVPKNERSHYTNLHGGRYIQTLRSEEVFRQIFSIEQTQELMKLLRKTAWGSIGARLTRLRRFSGPRKVPG